MIDASNFWIRLHHWWLHLLRKILHLWVRARSEPQPLSELDINPEQPVCYVLESYALSSLLILEQTCRDHDLPFPLTSLQVGDTHLHRSYGALQRFSGVVIRRKQARRSSEVLRLLLTSSNIPDDQELQIVPVTVLVGRAPEEEVSLTKILFSENWEVGGRIRRLLSLFINGRGTFVRFGQTLKLTEMRAEGLDEQRTLRKLNRVLRTHFRRVRTAAIGPDRSHRRTLLDNIIKRDAVQDAIEIHARKSNIPRAEAVQEAHGFAQEIAANYSYTFIRSCEVLLSWFWSRIYRGIEVHHFKEFQQTAPGHEVIYVPCHRSHIDYLLVSFILYQRGFVPPHVAAGVNLNLPILGSFLRRGGGFFLRRSFRSQALYAAVFNEYLSTLLNRGVHIEYFIEGTRSRTGRLLPPRAGMLAMTVKAFLQSPKRPVMFQPIYIGFEALVEGRSYQKELSGSAKRKESWWDLITSVFSILRRNYGQVNVSFGQPIMLTELLNERFPDWEKLAIDETPKPALLNPVVDEVAQRIMVNINRSAHAGPVNLLSVCLLATRQRALDEQDLTDLLKVYLNLLPQVPYSDNITVTAKNTDEIIQYGLDLNILTRQEHTLGNIIHVEPKQAVLLSYFRNNIAHLIAMPSLIASCFLHTQVVNRQRLIDICGSVYPLLRNELFLPWSDSALDDVVEAHLGIFELLGLLKEIDNGKRYQRASGGSREAYLLRLIAHGLLQTLERIYITVAVLQKNGSGSLGRRELEKLCQQSAERLSILHQLEAPEFADRVLFKQLIEQMLEMDLLQRDDDSRFIFDQRLEQLNIDAKLILSKEVRHSILQLAPQKNADNDKQNKLTSQPAADNEVNQEKDVPDINEAVTSKTKAKVKATDKSSKNAA